MGRRRIIDPRSAPPERQKFVRKVAPLDVEVAVDVEMTLEDFFGARPHGLREINGWIASGAVELSVASPQHYLPKQLRELLIFPTIHTHFGAGKEHHQKLCAIAAFFLMISTGKDVAWGGGSHCAYSGGWADVRMGDNSLFVECGTLDCSKLFRALQSQQTVMILPYQLGCTMTRETELALTFESDLERFKSPNQYVSEEWNAVLRAATMQLAYTYRPIAVPERNDEENNAAKGTS